MKSLHNSDGGPVDPGVALDGLFELAQALGALMEEGITGHGLTRARAGVLWVLLPHNGPMTQRAIADVLGVTPRHVTGLLDILQADGYISRARHPTDRRATWVELTHHGYEVATHLRSGRHALAAELFADIPTEHLAGFAATIATIVERVHAIELTPHCEHSVAADGRPADDGDPL